MGELKTYIESIELGIEQAKKEDGKVLYLVKDGQKKYIYSKYTPRKSALETLDFEGANKETFWIVCGMGLGYTVEEILKKSGDKGRVLVLEPSEKFLNEQSPYIQHLINDKRVFVNTGNQLSDLIRILERELNIEDVDNIRFVQTPVYTEWLKEDYLNLVKSIREYTDKIKMHYNTISRYAETHLKNIWKNKEAIKHGYDIRSHINQYKGIPAVVVSAGPSLNKNIEFLKNFKGIIFTGTRTLPHIMKLGIKPNFLVCVDPTDIPYELLREYKENDIDLIALDVASPEVIQHNKGKKYILRGTTNNLGQGLFDIFIPGLPADGSVSTLCLSSAYFMGCSPIMFIGQDLAYTDNQSHVDDFMNKGKDRIKRYVDGYYGGQVETRTDLMQFLRWFEKFIAEHSKNCEFINCTEGGAMIKGTRNEVFKEMVDAYSKDYTNLEIADIPLCDEIKKANFENKTAEVVEHLRQTKNTIELGAKLSTELLQEYTLYNATRANKINQILSKLEKQVDSKLNNVSTVIENVFTREYVKINRKVEFKEPYNETDLQKKIRICKRSIDLYTTIAKSVEEVVVILENLTDEEVK